MHQPIYDELLRIARNQGFTTYGQISSLAGLDMGNPSDRDTMSRLLEEIARHEQTEGKPMLTAVVIHKEDNMPGEGFFTIASEFGRFDGRNRDRFWSDSLNEVHAYWRAKA